MKGPYRTPGARVETIDGRQGTSLGISDFGFVRVVFDDAPEGADERISSALVMRAWVPEPEGDG